MAVGFRSFTSGEYLTVTTWSPTKPSGVIDNDLLIVILAVGSAGSTVNTVPTGWTLATPRVDDGTDQNVYFYWKLASSEPASWDWVFAAGEIGTWVATAWTGAHQTTPVNQVSGAGTAAGTDHVTPSITPTVDNCMLFAVASLDTTATTTWSTTDMTEAFEAGTTASNFEVVSGHYLLQAVAAAVSKTVTSSMSDTGTATLFAIAPAPDGAVQQTLALTGVGS